VAVIGEFFFICLTKRSASFPRELLLFHFFMELSLVERGCPFSVRSAKSVFLVTRLLRMLLYCVWEGSKAKR